MGASRCGGGGGRAGRAKDRWRDVIITPLCVASCSFVFFFLFCCCSSEESEREQSRSKKLFFPFYLRRPLKFSSPTRLKISIHSSSRRGHQKFTRPSRATWLAIICPLPRPRTYAALTRHTTPRWSSFSSPFYNSMVIHMTGVQYCLKFIAPSRTTPSPSPPPPPWSRCRAPRGRAR